MHLAMAHLLGLTSKFINDSNSAPSSKEKDTCLFSYHTSQLKSTTQNPSPVVAVCTPPASPSPYALQKSRIYSFWEREGRGGEERAKSKHTTMCEGGGELYTKNRENGGVNLLVFVFLHIAVSHRNQRESPYLNKTDPCTDCQQQCS